MQISVNGRAHELSVDGHESLAQVLRERLFLTGTKTACEHGECGSCTVLLEGSAVYACLTLAAGCEGAAVTTIEGVAARDEGSARDADGLHPVQRAFIEMDAVQCGYCTPGQIMSAVALLERDLAPTDASIAEAMSGNLCRCGTYPKIVAAIRKASAEMQARP